MPATPMPPSQLEQDIARILGLSLETTVQGSLVIEGIPGSMQARWNGAMTLTAEQADAVNRILDESAGRRRANEAAARARRALADLTPEQRRQVLADLEEGPTA